MYLESLIINHRDDIIHDLFVLLPLAPWEVKIIHKMLLFFFFLFYFILFFFVGGGGVQNITCISVVIQFSLFCSTFYNKLIAQFH